MPVWNDTMLMAAVQQMTNNGPAAPFDLYLRLFSNSFVPSNTDVAGDYTEVAITGYAPIYMPPGGWTIGPIASGQQASFSPVTFTFTSGGNVEGWYLTDISGSIVAAAGQFVGSPIVIPFIGGSFTVEVFLPSITP
jgi:hypothetical protein